MAGLGDKKPAPRKGGPPPHGSVCGGSSEPNKQGASTFSPSVSSNDSRQKLFRPVQPKKSSQCTAGSVGSDSGAAPVQPKESSQCTAESVGSDSGAAPVQPKKSSQCTAESVGSDSGAAPVQPKESSQCTSGSVGSDSRAATIDICMSDDNGAVKLAPSIYEINKQKRQWSKDAAPLQLRPGMVLLKRFIKPNDQAKIVKLCQQLGVGPGGFYKPGYRSGATLRLWMMCLGKNWDPESYSYGDRRPIDGAQPPTIPEEFKKFVQDAIQASNEFLKQQKRSDNAVQEIPAVSPDICLVNFYNSTGRLGLHQDKDESKSSIDKGLPVVSFSIGETAEFLYGEDRDEEKLSKVDLESGDVLIFGGKSRLIFHGVSNTKPKTAPKWLTDETSLRPGRLNLTFRQY